MGAVILAIRFASELAALVVTGWWGYRVGGIAAAIALPAAVAIVWGLWVAPRAKHRLRDPARFLVELVVWAGATASLVGLEDPIGAGVFGAVAVATAVGARRYEPDVHAR